MLKKIMMVTVLAGALDVPAAAASGHLSGDCSFESVQHQDTTGPMYQGIAHGYGVDSTGGRVSVHCEVRVGSETAPAASATPPGSGSGAAVTAGPISFTAADADPIWMCAIVVGGSDRVTFCTAPTHTDLPPPGTWELVDEAWWLLYGDLPTPCTELPKLGGDYGPVHIDSDDGDVWVNGTREFDCPDYDD